MVVLYVGGERVGTWAESEQAFAELARTKAVEFRDEAGNRIGVLTPEPDADDPDWVRAITPEETARRMAGPFLTLDEYRKRTERP